jgi:uncharacterized repeat protein (TIGR03803 family)
MLAAGALVLAAGFAAPGTASADAPTSAALSTLYSFSTSATAGQNPIGYAPQGVTAGPNGVLYALAQTGGPANNGAVVKFQAGGTAPVVIHGFDSNSSGSTLLAGAAGTLYGTDPNGGANSSGAVYSLMPDGSQYTPLYSFSALDPSSGTNSDGSLPTGSLLQQSDGSIVGETQLGGSNNTGVVYKVNSDGTGFTVLHSFGNGADGAYPGGGLTAGSDGSLYGVTEYGGLADEGTIFKIAPDGTGYTVLYQFTDDSRSTNADGATPTAALTLGNDGLLYGVTPIGGASGSGVLFQLGTDGSNYTVLYAFSGTDGSNSNSGGAYPSSSLIKGAGGNFYGTTASGGAAGQGTLFLLTSGGVLFNPLCSFDGTTGTNPVLTLGTDGSFYGVTADGGVNSQGSLFQVSMHRPVTHVLWDNASGAASLWNYDSSNGSVTQNTYGPYSGWTAEALADGPDDLTRVLWTNTDGSASLWSLDNLSGTFSQYTYGPYPGWTAAGVTVGIDNTTHVLWNRSDGKMACWNYSTDTGFLSENDYGAYSGWTALALADGSDALTRVLWANTDGSASLWSLNTLSGYFTQNTYGPYPGWTAQAISAGQ